jgi:DNA-binding NarL/FixJ family response regulator
MDTNFIAGSGGGTAMNYLANSASRSECRDTRATVRRRASKRAADDMSCVVQVVLADDAELMHLAVRALLAASPRYAMAAAASTTVAAEQLVHRVRPGLLICDTDIAGESGIGLCRWVLQVSPGTRVVMLTSRDEPLLARSALAAGASAYLLKDTAPGVLTASLDQAMSGVTVVDDRLGHSRELGRRIDPSGECGFSRREREVLGELIAGLDNRSIARQLCIAEDTVKTHLKAIFRKLGARDRAHAVALVLGTAAVVVPAYPLAEARAGRRWTSA